MKSGTEPCTFQGKLIMIMRHAEREDSCPGYTGDAMTDPEITKSGYEKTASVATEVLNLGERCQPTLVITSPFVRCIQTAQTASRIWHDASVVYDFGISEIHNERRIKGTGQKAPCLVSVKECTVPVSRIQDPQPSWDETEERASLRFRRFIERAAETYLNEHDTICLVSHGDAIGCAALMGLKPEGAPEEMMVYNVEYNGFVLLGYDDVNARWILVHASGVEWLGARTPAITLSAYVEKCPPAIKKTQTSQHPSSDNKTCGTGAPQNSNNSVFNEARVSKDETTPLGTATTPGNRRATTTNISSYLSWARSQCAHRFTRSVSMSSSKEHVPSTSPRAAPSAPAQKFSWCVLA